MPYDRYRERPERLPDERWRQLRHRVVVFEATADDEDAPRLERALAERIDLPYLGKKRGRG
jgi:hypothetical protein